MSGVNVLKVMDRDAELALSWNGRAKPESQQAFRESQEARAAVAELIEAASSGIPMGTSHAKPQESLHFLPQQAARLRNALSRVRGAE